MGYRGVSFFRTHFETNATVGRSSPESTGKGSFSGPAARILFQACSFYCRVWLNRVEIGDHIGSGYVAWWLDVSDEALELGQKPQHSTTKEEQEDVILTHELFVLVDNRFNSTTAPPHTGGDFWHYGGIMRSVEWHDRPYLRLRERTGAKTSIENKAIDDDGISNGGDSGVQAVFLKEDTAITPAAKDNMGNVNFRVSSTTVHKRALAGTTFAGFLLVENLAMEALYRTPKRHAECRVVFTASRRRR